MTPEFWIIAGLVFTNGAAVVGLILTALFAWFTISADEIGDVGILGMVAVAFAFFTLMCCFAAYSLFEML